MGYGNIGQNKAAPGRDGSSRASGCRNSESKRCLHLCGSDEAAPDCDRKRLIFVLLAVGHYLSGVAGGCQLIGIVPGIGLGIIIIIRRTGSCCGVGRDPSTLFGTSAPEGEFIIDAREGFARCSTQPCIDATVLDEGDDRCARALVQ